jgi:hypothetical protein
LDELLRTARSRRFYAGSPERVGIGFTFAGAKFYGHGVWMTSGSATFTINSSPFAKFLGRQQPWVAPDVASVKLLDKVRERLAVLL